MGLNELSLPPSLMADFYKYHLLETTAIAPVVAVIPQSTATKKGIQFLGKNQKGICLLVNYPKDVYLPDDQLHFVTSILQACRLNLGDVAIINHYREKINFEELRKELECHYLLAFGVTADAIGLEEMPLFTARPVTECYIVLCPAAEELNNNNSDSKLLKSKLWLCLKQLFNV